MHVHMTGHMHEVGEPVLRMHSEYSLLLAAVTSHVVTAGNRLIAQCILNTGYPSLSCMYSDQSCVHAGQTRRAQCIQNALSYPSLPACTVTSHMYMQDRLGDSCIQNAGSPTSCMYSDWSLHATD